MKYWVRREFLRNKPPFPYSASEYVQVEYEEEEEQSRKPLSQPSDGLECTDLWLGMAECLQGLVTGITEIIDRTNKGA